ncbi:MAG: glyoxylate/hydroxypyruvate reductase A [Pseudomonadota bacterium]
MTAPTVLFAGRANDRPAYAAALSAAADEAGLEMTLVMDPDEVDRAAVDYLVFSANGPVQTFEGFERLKAILNLWAGVEVVLGLPLPDDVPLVRMVEDGLTLGMVDYISGHVLRHHLDIDCYIGSQVGGGPWEVGFPPLARDRRVTVLGLGVLGTVCAERLVHHGFDVTGWARSPKSIPGVRCLSGPEGFTTALDGAEILILLLPQTPATERLINAETIARLAPGSCVINAGRGPLIDNAALLAALDSGHLRHATLDVFDVEPLPVDDPFWAHPRVTVTPHIASVTRPETAATSLVAQIMRGEAGEPFWHVVERGRGY